MRTKAPIAGLLIVFIVVVCLSASQAQEILTNDAVIALVKAGFSDDVIIAKIRSSQSKFDLSTNQLIALKQSGVSDAVVRSMFGAGPPLPGGVAAPVPDRTAPVMMPGALPGTTAGVVPSPLRTADVIYHLTGEKYVQLDAVLAEVQRSGAMFGTKSELVLGGRKAGYRVGNRQPVFLSAYAPTEAPLVRLKPGDDHDDRNLKIGSGGFAPYSFSSRTGIRAEDRIDVVSEKDSRGFYRITPRQPLAPGEYAFVLMGGSTHATGKVYDFGVD